MFFVVRVLSVQHDGVHKIHRILELTRWDPLPQFYEMLLLVVRESEMVRKGPCFGGHTTCVYS